MQHATQYLRPLIEEELIEERVRHIHKKPRRRKCYFLTTQGKRVAASLRNSLFEESIRYRPRSGKVHRLPLSRAYQEERRGSSLLELLTELADVGFVTEMAKGEAIELVTFIQEAPSIRSFYGREEEVAALMKALDSSPVVVVTGIAGIGKSTLGAKLCEAFRNQNSLFWREVRPWDSATDLALRLGVFLKALGRVRLHSFLSGPGTKDLSQLEETLEGDVAGISALLVFDDVHEASEEALNFFSILHRVLKRQEEGPRALILSRSAPTFYKLSEVEVEAAVHEISLRGLDRGSSQELLADQGVTEARRARLVRASGGSPLFLKLLAKSAEVGGGSLRGSLEAYIAQEIEPTLDEGEREGLQLASLYEVPVPSEALLLGARAEVRTLVALRGKNLLDQLADERLVLHDFLRDYFRNSLAFERRAALASMAATWLVQEAEALVGTGRVDEAIPRVENAVAIEPDEPGRLANLDRLGKLRRSVGDYEGAVETYGVVLSGAKDVQLKARTHRRLGDCLRILGRFEEAQREIQKGLALLPQDPSIDAALLLLIMALVKGWSERFNEANEALDRVDAWSQELSGDTMFRIRRAQVMAVHCIANPQRRDFANALEFAREAIELHEAGVEGTFPFQGYGAGALATYLLGQNDEALSLIERGWEAGEASGLLIERGNTLSMKAHILSEGLGEHEEAEQVYNEAFLWAKRTHQVLRIPWYPRLFANLYRRQGRPEDARESLAYHLESAGDVLTEDDIIDGHALMARICVECGDIAAAEEHLAQAERRLSESPSEPGRGAVAWARGVLRGHRGEIDVATTSFEEALSLDLPPFRGFVYQKLSATELSRGELLLDYGRFLASAGKEEEAREVILEALDEAKGRSRKALEDAALEELQTLGASLPE